MKKDLLRNLCASILVLFGAATGLAQAQSATLSVNGHSGQAPILRIDGRSYVDVEALARLMNGSLGFQANQITLTLPGSIPGQAKPGFSKEFLKAGIEEMTVIREWRIAIVNAVQTNSPITEEWVSRYRRTADSKLALASAAAASNLDRQAVPLLQSEFSNMQKLSDRFLEMHRNLSYISPGSLDNDPLDQQILACARGLALLAANGEFEDVPSCH